EYNPADLTVHVQAGVTLGQLQQALIENNQFLPLDPWNGPNATMGAIAAANAQGPFRAVGTLRDWIIGMKVAEVTGRISKAGGRVVKNVTGYDLHKLYTGSIGTLVIIADVSCKLRAKSGRTATSIAKVAAVSGAARLAASGLDSARIEWHRSGRDLDGSRHLAGPREISSGDRKSAFGDSPRPTDVRTERCRIQFDE